MGDRYVPPRIVVCVMHYLLPFVCKKLTHFSKPLYDSRKFLEIEIFLLWILNEFSCLQSKCLYQMFVYK